MRSSIPIPLLLHVGFFAFTAAFDVPNTLNVTTLVGQNDQSALECWALDPGFIPSTTPGIAGAGQLNIGPVGAAGGGNATIVLIPAAFDGGKHNAPKRQWVIYLSGLAHVTLPHSTDEAWIPGGQNGAILALDTADVSADGHNTTYPSDHTTLALTIPLPDGYTPPHTVLHDGGCEKDEQLP